VGGAPGAEEVSAGALIDPRILSAAKRECQR
jgi:hypothetical protein